MAAPLLRSLQALEIIDDRPTARWEVPMNDGIIVIEFQHGTATGRRVVKVDGKVVINREWMFRLVGDEVVKIGENKFVIRVDPIPGLKYSYTLWVNGKSYQNFIQSQSKNLKTWSTNIGEQEYRIVLDKNSQMIWVNGEQIEPESEFVDDGAEMIFTIQNLPAVIRSRSSGQKELGIQHILFIDDVEVTDRESATTQN